MTRSPNAIGFAPDYSARTGNANTVKSIFAALHGLGANDGDIARTMERIAPGNRQAADIATRAAVTALGTGSSGDAFKSTVLSDIATMVGGRATALGYLIENCGVPINLTSHEAENVPMISTSGNGVQFIPPAGVIPARQDTLDAVTVARRKVGVITVFTEDLFTGSNAGVILPRVAAEDLKLGCEKQMLDGIADNGIRPPGFRDGVSTTIAATGVNAMVADLTNLGSAVATIAGDLSNIVFVAHPILALRISIALPLFKPVVLASAGLLPNEIICLAINALVIAGGDEIRFSVSDQTSLHMEDAAPTDIGIAGTPPVVASPVRSLMQTRSKAVRMILNLSWALRSPNAVAWTTAAWPT